MASRGPCPVRRLGAGGVRAGPGPVRLGLAGVPARGSYVDVVDAARELCAGLTEAEQAAIFGGTARGVYGLRQPA